jgi:hypothetical protein
MNKIELTGMSVFLLSLNYVNRKLVDCFFMTVINDNIKLYCIWVNISKENK